MAMTRKDISGNIYTSRNYAILITNIRSFALDNEMNPSSITMCCSSKYSMTTYKGWKFRYIESEVS